MQHLFARQAKSPREVNAGVLRHGLLLGVVALAAAASGCAHTARHFAVPDATALQASGQKLFAAVAASKAAAQRASAAVGAARKGHADEVARLTVLVPKVEALYRLAPVELRPLVESVRGEVAELRQAQAGTDLVIGQAAAQQSTAIAQLEEANAARNEIEAKLAPAYFAEVEKMTERANAAEAAWHKDSAEIVKLKTGSWLYRIAAGLGLLVVAGLALLWFTGRLALTGAAVARPLI